MRRCEMTMPDYSDPCDKCKEDCETCPLAQEMTDEEIAGHTRTTKTQLKEEVMKYSVLHWCSHPDLGNDDLSTVRDFDDLDEALAFYNSDAESEVEYIELDGSPDALGRNPVRKNRTYIDTPDDDSEWRREMAVQNGMAFGCQGYNDTYGW
jgi:hypothetical protein